MLFNQIMNDETAMLVIVFAVVVVFIVVAWWITDKFGGGPSGPGAFA